jgi:hypothetical protein
LPGRQAQAATPDSLPAWRQETGATHHRFS